MTISQPIRPTLAIPISATPVTKQPRSPYRVQTSNILIAPSPRSPLALEGTYNRDITELLSASLKSMSISYGRFNDHLSTATPSNMFFTSPKSPGFVDPFHLTEKLEKEFCRNFTCCGQDLEDLHNLLKHIEEVHTMPLSQEPTIFACDAETVNAYKRTPSPVSDPDVGVTLADIYQPAIFESEFDEQSDSDSIETVEITLKRRNTETRRNSKKLKTPDSSSRYLPELVSETSDEGLIDIISNDSDSKKSDSKTLPKSCSLSVLDPETGERKYICAVPSCQKQYKNANGLKYHLSHAHPDGVGVPEEFLAAQKLKESESYRPYQCTVVNCTKRYKNLNGLKYHIEHAHNSLLPPSQNGDKETCNSRPGHPMWHPTGFLPMFPFPPPAMHDPSHFFNFSKPKEQ